MDILNKLREELQVERWQVEAAVKLIDEGNTIPFISRYRKEATGSLNDEVLRNLYERLNSLEDTINKEQLLFGINQGAIFSDIRTDHAKRISELDLDGYAIGGLAVGETHEQMYQIIEETVPYLPKNKPTYLMGVGTPANILEGVARGIDFFDCVYPSRNGRHGHVYTNEGKLNLFNQKYEKDMRPIEEGCQCPACRHYSRAYIRHLLKAKEMLGMRLCVLHNLYFYNTMMEEIRDALDAGNFASYKEEKLYRMGQSSIKNV